MFVAENKQTRPNTTVQFWRGESSPLIPPSYFTAFSDNYVNTGKFLNVDSKVSADGLELTTTTYWSNEAAFNEWRNDPYVVETYFSAITTYTTTNNIKIEVVRREEV